MPMLTLLQSWKLLMLQYMETVPALRLDDDDTTTDDVVAICLRLAVLQYGIISKPGTFTVHRIFHPSLADCQIIRSIDDEIGRDVF
ncbi:hypothetical protein TNCT_424141 [Trichonephila clavata]|uniref:Uncharacterized protein n=1 Tax=Trichonephila clavata TaxID=2740835 RepID=A0A8X6IVY5_TRICU|nr:hypothetical protein TNCT_424141 [Trichonephila clavata]